MSNKNKVVMAHGKGYVEFYCDSHEKMYYQYSPQPKLYAKKLQLLRNYSRDAYYQNSKLYFTPLQKQLYRDAMSGLHWYSLEQLKTMSLRDRKKIIETHAKTQKILNKWKQQIVTQMVDDLLRYGLPGCEKLMTKIRMVLRIDPSYTSKTLINGFRLGDLGISKLDVVRKLMETGILPVNFLELAPENNKSSV